MTDLDKNLFLEDLEVENLEEDDDDELSDGEFSSISEASQYLAAKVNDLFDDFDGIDSEDVENFDWCTLNTRALEAVKKRILDRVPRFMRKAKITNAEDLSIVNPPLNMNIWKRSWHHFLAEVVMDCFPELTFERFGLNSQDFFGVTIREIIIPLILDSSDEDPKDILNLEQIEMEFNKRLVQRLITKEENKILYEH